MVGIESLRIGGVVWGHHGGKQKLSLKQRLTSKTEGLLITKKKWYYEIAYAFSMTNARRSLVVRKELICDTYSGRVT